MKNKPFFLFDLDGTLCDSQDSFIDNAIMSYHSMKIKAPPREAIKNIYAQGLYALNELLTNEAYNLSNKSQAIKTQWKESVTSQERKVKCYEGIIETLTTIKKSFNTPMVMITNNNTTMAIDKLKKASLLDFFDDILCIDTPKTKAKPDPYMFNNLKKNKPHYPFEKAIMVGDTPADIEFAKACNIPIAWCKYGYSHEKYCLPLTGKHWILEKPTDLLSIRY